VSGNDTEKPGSDAVRPEPRQAAINHDGALAIGTELGEYIVDGTIGIGGCGAVYTAHHKTDDRAAAVKVMHRHMASSPKMVARFMREARAVDVIDHPNIVDIYDMGELSDGRPYQIMELVPGLTLASALETRGRFSPELTLTVLEPLCSALQEAHDAGVLHRDLKLSNVMVDFEVEPLRVKLLDFGVAKLMDTEEGASEDTTGVMMGTPQVMAPEQINGDPLDPRTDQYSLGVMVFTMLTGRPPFDTRDINALLQQHLSATPPRVSEFAPVGGVIDAVVGRALEKLPEGRYDSIDEFLEAFTDAARQAPIPRRAATQIPEPLLVEEIDSPDPSAVGIYISASLENADDEFDDDLLDDLSLCLEEAEVSLRDAGFQILLATGTALLGVKVLPGEDQEEEKSARWKATKLAHSLQSSLNAEAIERAVLDVHAHMDRVSVRGDVVAGQVTGGPLTKPDTWAKPTKARKAHISQDLAKGLDEELDVR
jgi:serine/threonine protein kinase